MVFVIFNCFLIVIVVFNGFGTFCVAESCGELWRGSNRAVESSRELLRALEGFGELWRGMESYGEVQRALESSG